MKVAILVGEPASGKTTVALEILKRIGKGFPFRHGMLRGTIHPDAKIIVFGRYDEDGQMFAGTDRLSMAVQPDAEQFISQKAFSLKDHCVFLEGDRLGNESFIRYCRAEVETMVFFLKPGEAIIEARHMLRGDKQTDTFKKSRKTKIANLEKHFPPPLSIALTNEAGPTGVHNAASAILGFFKSETPSDE